MRYIICEDTGSGFYFWSLIKEKVLKQNYQMIDIQMMKKLIPDKVKGNTVGVTEVKDYLETLTNGKYDEFLNNNIFFVCVDNAVDNEDIKNVLQSIYMIIGTHSNIHIFNYICFEQLLFKAGNELLFFPKLSKSRDYKVIKQHICQYGLGHSRELKELLDAQNVSYRTTETVFNKLLERSVVCQKQKIGNINYDRMGHHYIYKGKWSECWKMDCTYDCPNDKCWEATGNNKLACNNCVSSLKGISQSCIEANPTVIRKYAEEVTCNRNLPHKLEDRVKLLFSIPEVLDMDNY